MGHFRVAGDYAAPKQMHLCRISMAPLPNTPQPRFGGRHGGWGTMQPLQQSACMLGVIVVPSRN